MKDKDRINEVRKVLESIWQKVQAVGRCWKGKGDGNNPLADSHITFLNEKEAATVFYHEGILYLIEYQAVSKTFLGDDIKELLKKEGIDINNY